MSEARQSGLRGVVLDAGVSFTLVEFSEACGAEVAIVREMVAEGVIEPSGQGGDEWRFSGETLVRARCALRLVRDLRVNWPGAALALDLLERLEQVDRGHLDRR
jgi:chaperone modulatory protein CbpM